MQIIIHTDKKLRWLKFAMFFLVVMGIAMVIRRTLVLSGFLTTSNVPKAFSFDQGFSEHPLITLLHIIPGALFMILGPIQIMPRIRARYIQFHRWSGRVFMMAAYIIGLTALILPFIKQPIGGITEIAGTVFYSILFLVCLSMALKFVLRKQIRLHREWMIRTFSIGLAISTVRLITALSFTLFKLPPQNFMGTAFWLGFAMHLIAAEVWINYTRQLPTVPLKTVEFSYTDKEIVEQ